MKKLFQLFFLLGVQTSLAQSFTIQPNSVSSNALNTTANRVGINITSPNAELHINRNSNLGVQMQFSNNTTGNTMSDGFWLGIESDGSASINQKKNSPLSLRRNNIDKMVFDNDEKIHLYSDYLRLYHPTSNALLRVESGQSDAQITLVSGNEKFFYITKFDNYNFTAYGVDGSDLAFINNVKDLMLRSGGNMYFVTGTNTTPGMSLSSSNKLAINMNANLASRTLDVNGDARIGVNGTTVTAINNGTAWIDLPSLAPNNSYYTEVNVANVDAGKNTVMVSPSIALPNGFMITYSKVTVNNTVRIGFHNASSSAIDLIGMDFYITVITFP